MLPDERRVGLPNPEWDDPEDEAIGARRTKLSQLNAGEQFVYVFDFGDGWHHICTVGEQRIDPYETLGIEPERQLPYRGWGDIPDQERNDLVPVVAVNRRGRWFDLDCERTGDRIRIPEQYVAAGHVD